MLVWLKRFWTDPARFVSVVRAFVMGAGLYVESANLDWLPDGVGIALSALAMMFRAGEMQPPK